jgi:choline dehydrogenase-like flavoprotein
MTQSLYAGENAGLSYDRLEETRSRYLGGSTNCWAAGAGLSTPSISKNAIGFQTGWPFGKEEMCRHYVRSHSLLQLGPFNYDQDFWSHELAKKNISLFPLDGRRIDNIVSQFSPPSRFGSLYRPQLSKSSNVKVMLFANVTEIQTNESATEVTGVRGATLNGTNFTVSAKLVVLAAGGIENARLLLLSNQVQKMGLGNERGLVGRYFMDHPRIRWGRVRLNDQLRHRQLYDATMVIMRSGYVYKDVRIAAHVAPTPEWQRKLSLHKFQNLFSRTLCA